MASQVADNSFPSFGGVWTHDGQEISGNAGDPGGIWGGTAPEPSTVPDGTPVEVKKRWSQILQDGAETIIKGLQTKVFPMGAIDATSKGTTTPIAASKTADKPGQIPTFSITGKGSLVSNPGLLALAGLTLLFIFSFSMHAEKAE